MTCSTSHKSSPQLSSPSSGGSKPGMRSRRRQAWPIVTLMLFAVSATACAPGRTVLIADDSPIRIGPETTGKVYQLIDGEWVLSDRPVELPEGWYAVPPRFVDPDEFE